MTEFTNASAQFMAGGKSQENEAIMDTTGPKWLNDGSCQDIPVKVEIFPSGPPSDKEAGGHQEEYELTLTHIGQLSGDTLVVFPKGYI